MNNGFLHGLNNRPVRLGHQMSSFSLRTNNGTITTRSCLEIDLSMTVSEAWRWLVGRTRDSKPFFIAFATACGVVPAVIGYGVMQLTNSRNEQLEAQLRKNARPESLMMGQVNRERLAEFLGELQRKEDTNDRYVAALRGETLTRKTYQRIQPVPKQTGQDAAKEEK